MEFLYDEGELWLEAENRMKNLMWTVSGDYKLDTKLDMESYSRSKYISMYDAVKQGGFARFFHREDLAVYMVKKVYYGAEERPLTELAQLCVDTAVFKKISKERPGVPELRSKAFSDLLDLSFHKMTGSITGRIKIALLRGYLTGNWQCENNIKTAVEKIVSLEDTEDTIDIVRVTDELYNFLIDKSFERKHGGLDHVLAVTMEELREFDWGDFLEEEVTEDLLEQYLEKINSQVVTLEEEQDKEEEQRQKAKRKVVVITEEAAAKMYSYMELNYGKSYLPKKEQERINQKLCRGAHADCSLYFTDGILRNPVLANAQYVNAKRHVEKNKRLFMNSGNMLARNI